MMSLHFEHVSAFECKVTPFLSVKSVLSMTSLYFEHDVSAFECEDSQFLSMKSVF